MEERGKREWEKITLRIPSELHEALKDIGDCTGLTINSLMILAVLKRLNVL